MADIDPKVVEQVVQAYYPAAIQEATTARSRAQNGYAIAAAVAAAIVAAGVFGDFTAEVTLVQVLGFLALACWLIAALLFLWAVAGKAPSVGPAEAASQSAFVEAVLERVKTQRDDIEDRLSGALITTVIATTTTAVVILLAFLTEAKTEQLHGTIVLTNAGAKAVSSVCGPGTTTVSGKVDPEKLGGAVVKSHRGQGVRGKIQDSWFATRQGIDRCVRS